MTTASTSAARRHARSQIDGAAMRVPAPPGDVDRATTWSEGVPAGGYTSRVLGRGTRLRLRDPDGGACAHLLLLRADAPWERLNVGDTVKVPWQAYLRVGHPLLSDQGRLLATVVADSSGHHDALCGPTESGRAAMLLAAAKHGLDTRDVPPSIALFAGVRVGADGSLTFTGSAGAGAEVDLLIHLPVTVLIVNAPHPLDPTPASSDLDVLAWRAADELCKPGNDDPEYRRAWDVTETTWAASRSEGDR